MQTHEIFYPPDNKKEYNDQNIIEAITFISGHIHQFSTICIRYAWYAENCTFYPWIKLSSLSSSDFGIIILLPDYLPEEEKEARKEILRLKRMLKKTFPDILVTSNLRLSAKTLNEMEKKKKKRKINKE